jgi:hypothetical protein
MDLDPDPGGQKLTDPDTDSAPNPQHWLQDSAYHYTYEYMDSIRSLEKDLDRTGINVINKKRIQ